MANHKKKDSEIKKQRCISLSDKEVRKIKLLTKTKSLTEAIRVLMFNAPTREMK